MSDGDVRASESDWKTDY